VRRVQFRRWLAKIRISPEQLDELMKSSAPPLIFDARPPEVRAKEAYRIPGARALDLHSPEQLDSGLLTRPIVVYCVCPNEATAKRIIAQLHAKNIHHVQALKGGLDAWERRGYPVEPLSADFHAPREEEAERDAVLNSEYTVRARLSK
jgi:rhodanese-related sulfurtransferase